MSMFPGTFAASTPDKPAVVMAGTDETLTYRELDEGSARLARFLHEQGLRRGDGIALLTENCPRVFEVYWAAQRSGLYVTAVNHHLTAPEVDYIVGDCGAKALIVSAALGSLAREVATDVPIRLAYHGELPGFADYDATLADVSPEPLPDQPRGSDMLYSSGTTGRPKGIRVPLPERQVDEPGDLLVATFGRRYGFGADTVYLSPAPLYHAAPLRYGAMTQATGGTVVVMDRFDAEAALAAIERYRVTHSQWVPTMFVRMLKLPDDARTRHDLSSHRVAIHAAAPCPAEVKAAMIDWWGPILEEYYAATESAGITVIGSADWLTHRGSVGQALLGVLRICDDETGELLPSRQVGTVYFERDVPPFAYHNDPEKTASSRHPQHDNWATTGDLGYVDEDGWLYLTDRRAFMIISGGVNIYPREAEDALALHPAVLDVAVIGVPDAEMGESVLAVVSPAPDVEPGPELAEALIAHVRAHIAAYKAPKRIEFSADLPRTPTGKLVKQKLRERYA
jgi:long-chain acyl-CoA synthetase